MADVILSDIRLDAYTLDNMPLLRTLREAHFRDKAKAEVCIERARYVTEYLRDKASPGDSPLLRYAKAVGYFLSKKAPLFHDANLLAGTTTSKRFGAPLYPEFTGMTIWPELDTISKRAKNPQILSSQDADELNFDILPYWLDRSILEQCRADYSNPECMKLFQQMIFFIASKAGCISHTVPDYRAVVERGLDYVVDQAAAELERLQSVKDANADVARQVDFYRGVQVAAKGMMAYAAALAERAEASARSEQDESLRNNYLKMAEVCRRVPAKPARTFREAVNSLWLAQVGVLAENINMAISPGRLDQILYPYYRKDMLTGVLTVRDAIELVGCLWFKLTDNTNLAPETSEEMFGGAGPVPAVTVGGINADGKDAVNDLTYIILRTTEVLKVRDPSLNARYHYEKNSRQYRDRVCEVIRTTKCVPAFHNDVTDIATLVNQKMDVAHARDYAIIGCVELSSSGRSYDASSSIMLNLVAVLELALYNGKRPAVGDDQIGPATGDPGSFRTFAEFMEAFHAQLRWVVDNAVRLNEMLGRTYQKIMPSPLLSAMFQGPMESGRDLIYGGAVYNSSGATHIGFADTVDSLNAIERAVFRDRRCSFPDLIASLRNNFDRNEDLRLYLVNRTPRYGTDDKDAVKNSQDLVRFLYDLYQGYTNYRGGPYRPAYWSMTNHAGQGKMSGALPSGRKAKEVFSSGITPASQAARDLTGCLQAVAGLGATFIPGGMAFNLKYPAIEGDEGLTTFAQAIDTYLRCGGMHIQFNIMSYTDLIAARANPALNPELLVRVSGYSAYFNDLNDAMKEEIVTRTAYDLRTGQSLPLPSSRQAVTG